MQAYQSPKPDFTISENASANAPLAAPTLAEPWEVGVKAASLPHQTGNIGAGER